MDVDVRDSVALSLHRMASCNMYTRTVHDCFTSALDVQDGGFTVPSMQTEIAKSLATKVMVAVSSESGEKAHHTFENALLRRLHDVVVSSSYSATFSCRKKSMCSMCLRKCLIMFCKHNFATTPLHTAQQ